MAGTVLGTAAYMAPEHARGKRVDRRADVWAFGCCLFEALTGKRPFSGEDVSMTLAAVLTHPPDLSPLPQDLPEPLRTLLERCLAKDPTARLQDLGEARWWLARELEPAPTPTAAATLPPTPHRRTAAWLPPVLALATLALGLFIGRRLSDASAGAPPHRSVTRFELELDVTRSSQLAGRQLALSPDGESFVEAVQDGSGEDRSEALYLYDLAKGTGGIVEGTRGAGASSCASPPRARRASRWSWGSTS